ncbi:MAG: helix-turn-helix domain-containing protein [Oscillibacter sp.]|nr:helix-turn-helix domain-containing protein [Oscillibacter sp.]
MSYFGTICVRDIPHRAKAVYMYLKDRANRSGTCCPGINTIAKDLHLSRSTVKRALGDLTRRGFIKKELFYRENGSNNSNLYSVKNIR